MQRPFKLLGVQQIAIGSLDKNALKTFWVDLLGAEVRGSFKSQKENVDEDIVGIGKSLFQVEIDLMQPINPNLKPKVHEPALNHIGFWVDDIYQAYEWLKKKGVRFTPGGIRKGASGHDVCFIHPKANEEFKMSGEGVLIELIQAPKEVIERYDQDQ